MYRKEALEGDVKGSTSIGKEPKILNPLHFARGRYLPRLHMGANMCSLKPTAHGNPSSNLSNFGNGAVQFQSKFSRKLPENHISFLAQHAINRNNK
eukprot:15330575-Ditylum_brightwellii.AAC.2